MKTPEQIAEEMFREDFSLGQDDKAVIIAAINRDRAQRDFPMSDPLIELQEWASAVSQYMAQDKSNDWREEIAQLQAIEERLP